MEFTQTEVVLLAGLLATICIVLWLERKLSEAYNEIRMLNRGTQALVYGIHEVVEGRALFVRKHDGIALVEKGGSCEQST